MTIREYLAQTDDVRMTYWLEIETIDALITQPDGPTDPGDFSEVRAILDPLPLETQVGVDSALRGVPLATSVTLRLSDPSGWWRSQISTAPVTRLYAPVERDDTEIQVVDASALSAPGVVYIGRERITYTGITTGVDYDTLTGCLRGSMTIGYQERFPVGDGGVFPVYDVRTTPGRLEGRYVRVWGMPITQDGQFMWPQNEALEVWRGVIDSMPRSVDGSIWELQCKGLESLLNQTLRNENRGRALLVQPIWQTNVQNEYIVQPSTILRCRVEREVWTWEGGRSFVRTDQSDWVELEIPTGQYSETHWIGTALAEAIYSADPTAWPEFETGTDVYWSLPMGSDGIVKLRLKHRTDHWPIADQGTVYEAGRDDPNVYYYRLYFDHASYSASARGMQHQLRLPERWEWSVATETLREFVKLETVIALNGGVEPAPSDPLWESDYDYWETDVTVQAGSAGVVARAEAPMLPLHVSADRRLLAVEFPDGDPWDREGSLQAGEEMLGIVALEALDWATATGAQVYQLTVTREQDPAEPWTVELEQGADQDPQELTPVLVIAGASAVRCAAGLLTGCHDEGFNGAYVGDIGIGIYAAHVDLVAFAVLLAQPTLTGGRRAVYEDEVRVADWIAQNLALEELAVIADWCPDGSYRLRPVEISSAPQRWHSVTPDWTGAMTITSGLGSVVNQIKVSETGGSGSYRDLDSIKRYGVSRLESYELARISSIDGLANLAASAARIFGAYGDPQEKIGLPASPRSRAISPGDGVELAAGDLPTYYVVESVRRSWIGGREHCTLGLREIAEPSYATYAPVGEIEEVGVDGLTCTIVEAGDYDAGQANPYTGAESRAIDYFSAGDAVVLFDHQDHADSELAVIESVDYELSRVALAAGATPTTGQKITLYTRATASAQSAERYAFADEETDWS